MLPSINNNINGTHLGGGLEVPGVLPHAGRGGDAAGAHAGVVAEAALVQVRVVQRLRHRDPLLGVQRQHLKEEGLCFKTDPTHLGILKFQYQSINNSISINQCRLALHTG